MNAPQKVSPFWNFFNEKAFGKKSRPKIIYSQRKSLNANDKAYYCRVVKHLRMARSNECAPAGVPILKFFSRGADASINDGPVLIVSNTRTENLQIRFNTSLASCVSIENTYAPLLVIWSCKSKSKCKSIFFIIIFASNYNWWLEA